jgi:hypothetical protein
MALRIIGSGLPRTGTRSLKDALERLLGGRCYHMVEVFPRPDHVKAWHTVAHGGAVDWDALFDGYVAAVDWPASAFWPVLAAHWPDAIVLHSHRDPAAWYRSADATILSMFKRAPRPDEDPLFREMTTALLHQLTPDFLNAEAAVAAATRYDAQVRASAPAGRFVSWSARDGWAPLCAALGVPVPTEPFPHTNTTAEFRAVLGLPDPE